MVNPFIGEVIMFGGGFAPRGWALCDGQLLAISSNTALFSILGTTYGGDGRTTFALPDLRSRSPIHAGNGPGLSDRRLGVTAGVENVTLNLTEIPSHSHLAVLTKTGKVALNVSTSNANLSDPVDHALAGGTFYAANAEAGEELGGLSDTKNYSVTNSNTGGGKSHINMQPVLACNFIIALFGVYPSRS